MTGSRRRRTNRSQSIGQHITNLAASRLPGPVRSVVSTRWGSRLFIAAGVGLFALGILQVQWTNGIPDVQVDRERVQELKQKIASHQDLIGAPVGSQNNFRPTAQPNYPANSSQGYPGNYQPGYSQSYQPSYPPTYQPNAPQSYQPNYPPSYQPGTPPSYQPAAPSPYHQGYVPNYQPGYPVR